MQARPLDSARLNAWKLPLSALFTLLILALPLPHWTKAALFLPLWYLCLRPFTRQEMLAYLVINLNMVFMDRLTFEKGTFWFTNPDCLGLPLWEFAIWGYYGLASHRLTPPVRFRLPSLLFSVAFGGAFQFITDQDLLFAVTSALTVLMTLYFGKSALKVGVVALLFGIPFEWIGALTDQWRYLSPAPVLRAPLWGLPMWAGSLILFSHFLFPLLHTDRISRCIGRAKGDSRDRAAS